MAAVGATSATRVRGMPRGPTISLRSRHGSGVVLEQRVLAVESKVGFARRTVTVLRDEDFGDGKILIESKDDMRKRLGGAIGSSPDRADALCLAIDTTQQAVWFDDDPINPFERY